jgi:hypothetical protein
VASVSIDSLQRTLPERIVDTQTVSQEKWRRGLRIMSVELEILRSA